MPGPWSDQLRISLTPGEIAFVRFAHGARDRLVAKGVLPVPAQADGAGWEPVLRELRARARELGARPAEVTVVLSNQFVSYLLVPASGAPRDAKAWHEFVEHRFREDHGDATGGWCIRATRPKVGRSSLACGVAEALLRELRALLAQHALQLVSVQPLLVATFNQYRGTLGDAGCLLCYERGLLCCASFAKGEWRRLSTQRLPAGGSVASEIGRHLAGCHSSGNARTAFLCASAEDAPACVDLPGRHRVQLLRLPQRAGPAFGAALLGAR